MSRKNQIPPTIPISDMLNVLVLSDEHFIIKGRDFYTASGYLKKMGFSVKSSGLPYVHVSAGLADLAQLASISLFSPVLSENTGRGSK